MDMAQHVFIRVVDRSGQPLRNERVSIFATHIAATGGIPDQHTDARGVAVFDLEVDDKAEVIVYVRGRECCARGPLQLRYEISV